MNSQWMAIVNHGRGGRGGTPPPAAFEACPSHALTAVRVVRLRVIGTVDTRVGRTQDKKLGRDSPDGITNKNSQGGVTPRE